MSGLEPGSPNMIPVLVKTSTWSLSLLVMKPVIVEVEKMPPPPWHSLCVLFGSIPPPVAPSSGLIPFPAALRYRQDPVGLFWLLVLGSGLELPGSLVLSPQLGSLAAQSPPELPESPPQV